MRESRNSVSGCGWRLFLQWLLGLHCTSYAQGWMPSFHFETTSYDNISPFHCGHPSFKMLDQQTLKQLTFATTSKQLFQLTCRNNADSHRLFVRPSSCNQKVSDCLWVVWKGSADKVELYLSPRSQKIITVKKSSQPFYVLRERLTLTSQPQKTSSRCWHISRLNPPPSFLSDSD